MRLHVFSSSDLIYTLSFFAKCKDACSLGRALDSTAVWCYQFYVEGQASSLLRT